MSNKELNDVEEKDDVRYVPKQIIKELIVTYRAHPALWQVKNKNIYGNRMLKHKGYQALVKIWKKYDRDANIRTVRNKVQSLRGSFRKELKKLRNSQKSETEDLYKPQLWYFSLMTFLTDHEQPTESVYDLVAQEFAQEPLQNHENNDDRSTDEEPGANTTAAEISYVPKKKKRRAVEEHRKFSKACTDTALIRIRETENDAFGKFISKKLERVSNDEQRMYAESLITKVVNYAILNKLSEFADITGNTTAGLHNYPSTAVPGVYHPKMENPLASTSACDWNDDV